MEILDSQTDTPFQMNIRSSSTSFYTIDFSWFLFIAPTKCGLPVTHKRHDRGHTLAIFDDYGSPLERPTLHNLIEHRQARIIEVKLVGLCSMDEFRIFTAELRAAIASFPPGDQPPATLYDFTDATIQTQEVVTAMKALAEHPAMIHRRVAMYTEGVLARRQALRISENRLNMCVFKSRADALEWLGAP